jgi:hypothetical protein
MSTATRLSPEEIKNRVATLQAEFEQMRQQAQSAERRGREINKEIRGLQRECPHEHTTQQTVMDVAEAKLRTFCTDCGAQC